MQIIYLIVTSILVIFILQKWLKNSRNSNIDIHDPNAIIIDVRSVMEFKSASNPKSINVPLDQFQNSISKLDPSKTYLLCCASGVRSSMACQLLKKNGFNHVSNLGSWKNSLNR